MCSYTAQDRNTSVLYINQLQLAYDCVSVFFKKVLAHYGG